MAGRPREFDRDLALAKARDAFWERGYEGVSIADLSELLGLASARIYAAFGSKEALFREAIALYDEGKGGFATRALAEETTARMAIRRVLVEAIELYTKPGRPAGCMVVAAATNCSSEHQPIAEWLSGLRRKRTASLVDRLAQAAREGELAAGTDVQALGDFYAAFLHGLSVQARDGVGKARLLETLEVALSPLRQPG